jgi:hypothetical protein
MTSEITCSANDRPRFGLFANDDEEEMRRVLRSKVDKESGDGESNPVSQVTGRILANYTIAELMLLL